jgi:hypothetical protein
MGKSYTSRQNMAALDVLRIIKLYYQFLKKNFLFEKSQYTFWHFFKDKINLFYNWASPDIIKTHGIGFIKELLEDNDIYNLVKEKDDAYLGFKYLDEKYLDSLSFLTIKSDCTKNDNYVARKTTFVSYCIRIIRKIIKFMLPYFVVRLIQLRGKN